MLDVSGGAVVVAAAVNGVPRANATMPANREAIVTVAVRSAVAEEGTEEGTLMGFILGNLRS